MSNILAGIRLAVIGGDDRELVLIPELIKQGANVKAIGLPQAGLSSDVEIVNTIYDAITDVNAIILPMPGTDNEGKVRAVYSKEPIVISKEIIANIPSNVPIFIGIAKPFLLEWANYYNVRVIEIAENDELAILNSIPSAEGAIQISMEKQDITIHGSNSIILGFGRCGKTLARMLQGLGSKTFVTARKPADLARIYEMGFNAISYDVLPEIISSMDTVYNTIPELMLNKDLLQKMNRNTLIVDIASAPGGVDYTTAEELGIKAILAPGLPGKVAPRTAGKILAKVLPPLIIKELSLPQSL